MSSNQEIRTRGSSPDKATKEVQLNYSVVETQIRFLQGKVLTVIEASIINEPQQKAVKDLIKKMFSEQLSWIADLCFPELPMRSREQVKEMGYDVDEIEKSAEVI